MPVKYKVSAEVLLPSISTTDLASIFEEYRICKQLGVLGRYQFHEEECVGVFGKAERRFLFKSIIVGSSAKARFKISNTNKVHVQCLT